MAFSGPFYRLMCLASVKIIIVLPSPKLFIPCNFSEAVIDLLVLAWKMTLCLMLLRFNMNATYRSYNSKPYIITFLHYIHFKPELHQDVHLEAVWTVIYDLFFCSKLPKLHFIMFSLKAFVVSCVLLGSIRLEQFVVSQHDYFLLKMWWFLEIVIARHHTPTGAAENARGNDSGHNPSFNYFIQAILKCGTASSVLILFSLPTKLARVSWCGERIVTTNENGGEGGENMAGIALK